MSKNVKKKYAKKNEKSQKGGKNEHQRCMVHQRPWKTESAKRP